MRGPIKQGRGKSMAIIRTKRTKNFTVLNNDLIRDSRLSFKARGLLQYMLSMPDDWKFYVSELAKHSSKEGESAIRSGIEELEKLGYMRRIQNRDKSGKFGAVDWEVLDEPVFSPHVEKPQADKPNAEKPQADNRPLLRTNSTKNLYNKELNNSCSSKQLDETNAFVAYQMSGATLNGQTMPMLTDYVQRLGNDLVCHAIDIMSLGAEHPNFKFLQRILDSYENTGITTVEQAIEVEKQFKAKKQQRQNNRSNRRNNTSNEVEWYE